MSKTIDDVKQELLGAMCQGAYNDEEGVWHLARAYSLLVDAQYREWSYSTARTEPKDAEPPQNGLGES